MKLTLAEIGKNIGEISLQEECEELLDISLECLLHIQVERLRSELHTWTGRSGENSGVLVRVQSRARNQSILNRSALT